MREGSREAASGSCPFGSDKRWHLAPHLSPGKTWLGLRVDDNRLQTLFFPSVLLKKMKDYIHKNYVDSLINLSCMTEWHIVKGKIYYRSLENSASDLYEFSQLAS